MSEEAQARVGKRLDDVAKILAGALVAVAGIMTALGLTSDIVFVALNNESWPIYAASLCAVLAIVCSIVALLIRPTPRGILWETVVLILGVIFYMVSLSVAVVGASKAAGGNGRPTITDVELKGHRPDLTLSFTVRADGVDTWATIEVYADAVDMDKDPFDIDFYSGYLRPDDKGVVEQRVSSPITVPEEAWGIEIGAVAAGGSQDCESLTERGPACATIKLPPTPRR
ncbi:hypothetical protein [Streptomyces xantholiticus]|uniref:hypothetical protein n=1 Tax=Streptomyces xantholiticus TaxID=68285 RepID=UPI001672BE90|nr:hypothetical protein [Streptomyces xantholiticus]